MIWDDVWANELFPEPYIYEDKSLGNEDYKFTIDESGLLPDRISVSLQQRTRYESLNNQFRFGTTGSDQVLSFRTLAQVMFRLNSYFKIQLELQDSRAELADSGTQLNTSIVNTGEILEGNIQWLKKNLFQNNSCSILRIGRVTMDVGKRRMIARNRFRNTKNSFTGLDWIWKAKNGNKIRTTITLPVIPQPTSSQAVSGNTPSLDDESFNRILWGLLIGGIDLPWGNKGEFYIFGLHERDDSKLATHNRKLYSPGFRLYQSREKGRFDYEWESIVQLGSSRATDAITDTKNLDHFAHFHHIELGYTFYLSWSPRFVLAYDYASGDSKPNDGKNGRFDTLFGASVFDFGPTSIHKAFSRSNISGPGAKFTVRPKKNFSAYLHYRAFWLASDFDIWAGNSSLRDSSGNSNSFLGQQLFLRGRWQVLANLQLEAGLAYRINGNFQDTVPGSPRQGDTIYSYISVTLSF